MGLVFQQETGLQKPQTIMLRVQNLTKTFDHRINVVDQVSFEVFEGEIFGFLGPNGAGKSVTIRMLTTVLKPSSGTAIIGGNDISKNAQAVRRKIGVVPQEYTADEDLTGFENVMLCATLYGIRRSVAHARAHELLDLVELSRDADRKVDTYSGGMRRRLEIACGLINRPRLLFLDEPTLGLDVQTRAAVWSYIRKLKQEFGMTLFMTTHCLEEADSLCDRIALIDHGKIIKMGTPLELKESIGGDIVQLQAGDQSDLTDIISNVKNVVEVTKEGSSYRIWRRDCPSAYRGAEDGWPSRNQDLD